MHCVCNWDFFANFCCLKADSANFFAFVFGAYDFDTLEISGALCLSAEAIKTATIMGQFVSPLICNPNEIE